MCCNTDIVENEPLVSVIIVTYNNTSVIENCLLSLRKQSYSNFETIVVDNCSVDSTVNIVKNFNEVRLIEADTNLGFTGGNILGLTYTSGNLVVLLNPDTEPCIRWLESLVHGIKKDPCVGLCASKLIVHGSHIVDSAGDGCTTTARGFKRGEGESSNLYDSQEYIFGACGGAVMLRRKLIDDIGFLDDDFFLIHEDTDLNFRAQLAGWKCLFIPSAVVYHKVRSSIGVMSDLAVYYSIRNSRLVWLKNMPLNLMLKYFPHLILQEFGALLFFVFKHKKANAYFRANCDFFKSLPSSVKKRRVVMKQKRISNAELEGMLTSLFEPNLVRQKLYKIFGKVK